jgi:hypothetical protein
LANVNLNAADLSATEIQSDIAIKLIQVGFDADEVMKALGLPQIAHSGLPSVQLQPVADVNAASVTKGK